jgi:hypothetical protein
MQAYADRHGYDVIVDGEIIDATRPTSWSKLLAMRKYLPSYDFLFYVDVDTIITNVDVRLEDIVDYGYDQILAAGFRGQGSRVKSQGSRVQGQGLRVRNQGSRVRGQGSRVKG